MDFKFFQKQRPQQSRNRFLDFDMDKILIIVLRYKLIYNLPIIGQTTSFQLINIPINGWLEINTWINYDRQIPEMIEIDYSIVELNTMPIRFTFRMETTMLLEQIQGLEN